MYQCYESTRYRTKGSWTTIEPDIQIMQRGYQSYSIYLVLSLELTARTSVKLDPQTVLTMCTPVRPAICLGL
jgi:hypothetical protein